MKIVTSILFTLFSFSVFSQSLSITPANVEANSITKPIVINRLTLTALRNLPNPVKGTLIYDITNHVLRIYNGNTWIRYKSYGSDIYPGGS